MIYARAVSPARESCVLFQVDFDSGKSCSKIAWTAGIASSKRPGRPSPASAPRNAGTL
jgi:hypothetical protein